MPAPGISPSASLTLEQLTNFPWIDKFYLAGGTALALQLHHRLSFDLDFFSPEKFDPKKINADLQSINNYKLDRAAENTLLGIIEDIKISFFTYKYPLISKGTTFRSAKLASIQDIAAMKIDAIEVISKFVRV